jgi:hypothetical protein
MKCWNSAFNAQGLRVIIVVVQGGKSKDRVKLNLLPKLLEKLVWVPIISFCKIFIPSYSFDALLCWNWLFAPTNRGTLWITRVYKEFWGGKKILVFWACISLQIHTINYFQLPILVFFLETRSMTKDQKQ